jgi:hypothetical protein
MSNIRPTYPPKPSNPEKSQGNAANVGAGADPKVIRPEYDAKPSNPASGQGSVVNIAGSERRPNVGRDV